MTNVETRPAGGRAAARRAAQDRPRKRRWLRITALVLGFLLAAGCGAGYWYYQKLNGNFQAGQLNLSDVTGEKTAPNAAGQTPLNILLIGTDNRGSAANIALGGSADEAGRPGLADVQMLLHVAADRSNASLISIPRDTLVDIPACRSEDGKQNFPAVKKRMINEALARGGPGCLVGTWTELTKVHIDHYMMVDFAGVASMADAVGGVPVCVNMNLWDRYQKGIGGTDLKLPKGTTYIKGEQALKWLRVRDAWGDDIGRTKAQHLYLSAMVRELKAKGSLTDPGRLMGLAEAATKSLSVDKPLADIRKLYELGTELRAVPTERISTLTVPVVTAKSNADRLDLKQPDSDQIWKLLLADRPLDDKGPAPADAPPSPAASPTPAPGAQVVKSSIQLTVQNASGAELRAKDVRTALNALGFTGATAPGGGGSQAATQLTYAPAQAAQAQAVAAALGLPPTALKESGTGRTLALVIGADWPTGTTFPVAVAPTQLPKSAEAVTADDDKSCMTVNPQGRIYTY
ncbi:LCP family protein [Kitasatospora sp. NPDC002040]|uniref:LCP family protein n=1 Tax=Kitasatospora sp. NPDC002040 TaxID=3154661 RepID=UPI00331C13B1